MHNWMEQPKMSIDADRLKRVSALFDEFEELSPAETEQRLQALRISEPEVALELMRWLDKDRQSHGALDGLTQRFLAAAQVPASDPGDRSGQHIGAFDLLRRIGRGGMGEVYEARRPGADFEQKVAIKLLRRGLDSEDIVRRFLRERRILAQLEHPGIARLIDGGMSDDGLPYLVMEFVDGTSLIEAANAHALDLDERLQLFLQICDAVAYAHRRLIVHRDLKPSNVLLTTDNQPKLLDFGIAKLLDEVDDERLTGTGIRVLTPSYAAPEQILGQPISTATDVYALGVILYELLTGASPHQRRGKSVDEVARNLEQESLSRPSNAVLKVDESDSIAQTQRQRLARQLDGDLDTIVLHALKREPERRYQGAAELADDIRRHLNGHPVRAETDTMTYRMRKFVKRHRGGVTAVALAILGIVTGLVLALWQADHARQQTARAEAELRRAESIKEFALSLFREQDPLARGKPEPRSANELIAIGVERARAQFANDPELRSQLLNDLGEIQSSLGDYQAAISAFEQALRERAQRYGPDSIQYASTQGNLASARIGLGETAPALKQLEDSAALLSQKAGPESSETLKVRARLVMALANMGRTDEAVALARALLPAHERVFGPDAPQTVARLADIATLLEQNDQLAEAEVASQSLIERIERAHGSDYVLLIRPLGMRGDILRRRQKYPEADAYYLRAIALARQHKSDPLTARVLLRRGDLLRRMGRMDEAAGHLDEAATLLPPASPDRAQVEMMRAGLARARGDMASAANGFLDAHQRFLAAVGSDSVYPWNAAMEYVITQREAGKGPEAEPLLLEAVANLRRIAKPNSFEIMLAAGTLGEWRALQDRHAEAAPLLLESIAVADSIYGAAHPTTVKARLAYAASLVALGDAESLRTARGAIESVLETDNKAAPLAADARQQAQRLHALTAVTTTPK
jgi:eukaryotic-like serine/threonine-protein kinase